MYTLDVVSNNPLIHWRIQQKQNKQKRKYKEKLSSETNMTADARTMSCRDIISDILQLFRFISPNLQIVI